MLTTLHRVGSLVLAGTLALGGGAPSVADAGDVPDLPGPWHVGHTKRTAVDAARADRQLPLDLWYPVDPDDASGPPASYPLLGPIGLTSDVAFEDVPVSSAGVRPLVVFSHGFGGIATQSIKLMEHLASHGFVVVAPTHTGNAQGSGPPSPDPEADRYPDVAFVIDELAVYDTTPGDAFFGRVDTQNVGVAGHSFGGMTAQFMAAGHDPFPPDPRVKAIMPIAASSSRLTDTELASIAIPTLLMVGTLDGLQAETIRSFSLGSGAPFLYRVDVIGANHTHFANVCDIGNFLLGIGITIDAWPAVGAGALVAPYQATCIPPAFPIAEATRIQNLYAAALFRRHLMAETYYDSYLTSAYAAAREPDTSFFGGGPATIDPFMCYRARSTTGLAPRTVDLQDAFETGAFDLKKTLGLCAPGDVEDAGVGDECTYLESYRISGPKHEKVTGVVLSDRFGTLSLDLLKPETLLVPAAERRGSPAPAVGDSLDSYKCYKVRITRGTPRFPAGVQTAVADAFEGRLYDLKKPHHLCTPVDADGAAVVNDVDHLLCYRATRATGEPKHVAIKGQINVHTRFGTEQLDTIRETELCVPATRVTAPPGP